MGELRKRGKVWMADYVDRDGKRVRRSTRMTDQQLAAKVLRQWETGERAVELGIVAGGRAAGVTIADCLKDYVASLSVAGRSDQHKDRTKQLVESVKRFCKWETLADISSEGLNRYCESLKTERQANRTVGATITAVRSFARYAVRRGVLPSDPTATIAKPSVKVDRRITRRMILPGEWNWVQTALAVEVLRNGQSSQERLLMYRAAIETGLRSNELRELKRSSLTLDSDNPHVTAKASTTKNSKMAKQLLSDSLAGDLAKFCQRKHPGAAVFNPVSRTEMARVLRADVADARRLWLDTQADKQAARDSDFLASPDSQQQVIDFHALRHTCGGWATLSGVSLNEVKELMRHSTIVLTADAYGHIGADARSRNRNLIGKMLG